MTHRESACCRHDRGFTLTELAVVIFILALLIGGTMATLSAQNAAREINDTQRTLELARDALVGFAVANGRLPCPTAVGSGGRELPAGGGACTIVLDPGAGAATVPGFLPAVTLGLSTTDANGLLPDVWGNPVRYAVTRANVNAFTTTNGLKNLGFTALAPDLVVCVDQPGPGDATCGANRIGVNVVALVFSPGKSSANLGPLGPDEQENLNVGVLPPRNPVFVNHEPRPDFDDLLVTLSPNVLYNRMIAAGGL